MTREDSPPILAGHGTAFQEGTDFPELVRQAEAFCRAGEMQRVVECVASIDWSNCDVDSAVRILIAHGTALYHLGDVIDAIRTLHEAVGASRRGSTELQFKAASALFFRESSFLTPEDALRNISGLRQLATSIGDATSLGSLHVAVGRLEACQGNCVDAHRHIEIARRLANVGNSASLHCAVDLVESGLELVSGNLVRARSLAESSYRQSDDAGFANARLAAATNLATIAVWTGHPTRAKHYVRNVMDSACTSVSIRAGAIDVLAQIAFFEDDADGSKRFVDECASRELTAAVPSPSWNRLSCEITRCSSLELFEDWNSIVDVATEFDAELARRQFRALRAALAGSRARALARLGRTDEASSVLGLAVRVCPRGAIDPLIVVEASKGVCLSLKGDLARGSVHFERALAACRAIGHRYHERWIERDRRAIVKARRETVHVPRHDLDLTDAALLVSDAAAILSAGRSIDLLAHGAAEILKNALGADTVELRNESGRPHQAELTASAEAGADGTFTIRLRGSDRLVCIRVRHAQSLDEVSLLRAVGELVRVAVSRTADSDSDDEEQNLWPKSLLPGGEDAIFQSPRMTELLKIAIRLASTELPILLTGETGTGKEIFAHLIHEHSHAKRGPFVPYNCSAMPRDLVESQLFGHRRGAFTGAVDSFPGLIRAAERGTLFLDEIGDLDPAIQPKLLRFLEGAEIHPIGELKPQRVPVRIVAATNADLDDLVDQGRFRRDLFYRLGVACLALPPLRERKDEIPRLASLFLQRHSRECRRAGVRLGDDLIAALLLYDWPGNIRQLTNEIRRIVAMASDGQTLGAGDLSPDITRNWNARPVEPPAPGAAGPAFSVRLDQPLDQAIAAVEREFINRAMDASGGRVADAAQLLGISRKGLFLKRRRWKLRQEAG